MNTRELFKTLEGKTIKKVLAGREEASDSCAYGQMIIKFTDGSEFQFQFHAMPQVRGIYFKDEKDMPMNEVTLVEP